MWHMEGKAVSGTIASGIRTGKTCRHREKEWKGMLSQCEDCQYYGYDEEYECYGCEMETDEDEYAQRMLNTRSICPYYRRGDEYSVVKKQM